MQKPNATVRDQIDAIVRNHPIVRTNPYTTWFAAGELTLDDMRALTVQFSVFSHLFIEAQLRKCINADSLESYRAAKQILLNELGVVFGSDGSVDRSPFRFDAAHYEWLVTFAGSLGLRFDELGKRRHGSVATLHLCDELMRLYGSDDVSVAAGASYAIEHWAAAGFWKELIAGLRIFKARVVPELPLGFWTFHDAVEDQHAAHAVDELDMVIASPDIDLAGFVRGAQEILDAVAVFWQGLAAEIPSLVRRVA